MFCSADGYSEISAKRLERAQLSEVLDEKYGYDKLKLPCEKLGWLVNMCAVRKFAFLQAFVICMTVA